MRYFFLILAICGINLIANAQSFTYNKVDLNITIRAYNPCGTPTPDNGYLEIYVNAAFGGSATLIFLDGPGGLFANNVTIPVGPTPYIFNPGKSLPDGLYNYIIRDQSPSGNTINSFAEPATYAPVTLFDLSAITLSQDILQNNTVCTNPTTGQVQSTITGGSKTLPGGGSYHVEWNSTNGLAGLPFVLNNFDGNSPLNLASLLGVAGLPGGTYTLSVYDNYSSCGSSAVPIQRSFVITDPSPAVQTVTTPSPYNICAGDNMTITMNNSENLVNYTILRNGLSSGNSFVGNGAGPFVMTFPSAGFSDGDIIQVRAQFGFCSPAIMANSVQLRINPVPTISGAAIADVCQGILTTNFVYSSTTSSPGQFTLNYDVAAEAQGFSDLTLPLTASPIAIPVPGGATPGSYNALLTVTNLTTLCPSTPIPVTVNVIANPAITLNGNPSVCLGSTSSGLAYSATAGSPNRYTIDFDVAAEAVGFVDVPSTTFPASSPIPFTIPGGAGAGVYNATVTVSNTTTGCASTSQPFTITINPNPTITLGTSPQVCAGVTAVNLPFSATTASPNQFIIDYDAAAEAAGFVDGALAPLPATPGNIALTIPAGAAPAVYNGTVTVSNAATTCVSPATPFTVTINPSPTITLTNANPSVCLGVTSTSITYSATTGSPGEYTLDFDVVAEGQGFSDVTAILTPGAIGVTIPGGAVAGVYNATLTVRNIGTTCVSTVQNVTVTINPNPTITLTDANPQVCFGATAASFPYSATTGSPDQYSIVFDAAAITAGFANITNATIPASQIGVTIPGTAGAAVYNATLTIRNSGTGCPSASQPITITINPTPTITLDPIAPICQGVTSVDFGYSAITGGATQYIIDFNAAAEAQGFVDVPTTNITASPMQIVVPAGAAPGTYTATVQVVNVTTTCPSAPQTISITINAVPTITVTAPNPAVCIGTATAPITFSGTTGGANQYSIDFDVAAEAQGFVDITAASLTSPIVVNIPPAAVAGTYNATLTAINSLTSCGSTSQAISITISPNPTVTLGANPEVCAGQLSAGLPYTAVTAGPDRYSIDYNPAAEAQGFVDVVDAILPAASMPLVVPPGAVAGVYNASVSVKIAASGCVSAPQAFTVTINPSPSITLQNANPAVCIGALTTSITYTATTGSPTDYTLDFDAAAEAQGFIDVTTALSPGAINVTIPVGAVAGTYSATLTVLNSSTTCPSVAQTVTITISPVPTITVTNANPAICLGETTASLPFSGTTGSPDQYSLTFDAAAISAGFTNVVNATLTAPAISVVIPGSATAATYNATLAILNSLTGCPSTLQPVTITINPTPTITLSAISPVCSSAGTINVPYSAVTGGPTQYSVDFNAAAEAQGFVDVVDATLTPSNIVINIPTGVVAGNFGATVSVHNVTTDCRSTPQSITIPLLASPQATISPDQSICAGSSTNVTITFTGTAPWSFVYNDGTTDIGPIPSFFNSISIPVNPSATTTYEIKSVSDATGCPGTITGTGQSVITVNQPPQTNLTVNATINPLCSGGSTGITVAASQLNVSYQLRIGTANVGTAVTGTGGLITLLSGPLTANTTFNVLATATGCTAAQLTNTVSITVAGSINAALAVNADASIVCGGTGANIILPVSENGVTYQLRNAVTNANIGSPVASTGGQVTLPTGILTATTEFKVFATNGTCSIELTDTEEIQVGTPPDATLGVNATLDPLCVGGTSDVRVVLSEIGVQYQLRNDADDSNIGTAVAGTGADILLSTGVLNANTTFNVLANAPGCGSIELVNTVSITVVGNIDPGLDVAVAADPICAGTGTDVLITASEAGVDYQLYDASNNNSIGAVVAGGGNIVLPTGNLTVTTTFFIIGANATCSIILTERPTVNVDPSPDPTLAVSAALNPLCVGGSTDIRVNLSENNVTYELRNNADNSLITSGVGTGGTLLLNTGVLNANTTFKIMAISAGGICPPVQLNNTITINVSGTVNAGLDLQASAAAICSGGATFIQVVASEVGVSYQLQVAGTGVGAVVAGTGAAINLSTGNLTATTTFSVVANNGACSIVLTDTQQITVSPSPNVNGSVTASPSIICPGSSAVITVANSQIGVSYDFKIGSTVVGTVAGTGNNITFNTGALTTSTTYNVFANAGTCSAALTNTATVNVRLAGDPACGGTGGPSDCTNFSSIQPSILTQPSCNDRDAGEVAFSIARADGTPTTFRIIWTINGVSQTKFTSSTATFDDLSSGLYQYTVIDEGNGKSCGPVDFFLDLKTQVEILTKQVTSNVTCFGGTDGNAILSVDGSTTGEYWYRYVVRGAESVAQTFTPGAPLPGGLPADDTDFIIIKVDDNFNFTCPDTVMVRVKHTFPKIDFAVASTNVTTCNGIDGGIQVTAIGGGDSGSTALQIRLKRAVPFSTDPSGYVVAFDYENVAAGAKSYTALPQGNYVVDVKDRTDCVQSKPIAIQAPGQVPLSSVSITAADANCANNGESGTIRVSISDAGIYKVALSQDQVNVPADADFVDYNAPSLPSITFNNLASGAYYLYIKSSTTTCPTRTDAIMINGVTALADFEVLSNCTNVNLTLNNITGQPNAAFVIRVFNNSDKFFKIDSLAASEIPLSRSVSFINSATQHTFLTTPGTYRFVMVQTQSTGTGSCALVSDTVVYSVRELLGITLGQIKPSYPNPKHTGSIEVANIMGGTRFLSSTNQLYYEISLTTADDDIVVVDWTQVKLDPQNKFIHLFEYLPAGVYRVKVRDAAGCTQSVVVEIPQDMTVYVPNFFTPNEDNVNDEFEVLNLPVSGSHKLIITNRWGNEVFKSNDYRDGNFWDANDVADGVYYYRLKVDGGDTFTGWVEVLRGSKP